MSSWQKYLVLPLTIALASVYLHFYAQPICDCESMANLTSSAELKVDAPANESETISESFSQPTSYESQQSEEKSAEKPNQTVDSTDVHPAPVRPKFWMHHYSGNLRVFETIKNVLERLDFEQIAMNLTDMHFDWDIVWGYQWHDLLKMPLQWRNMQYYQKVNHIPGNQYMTSKSLFGVATRSKYVPRAFTDVDELKKYAQNFPEKLFVMKLKSNRGVHLKKVSEMDFKHSTDLNSYFAQEFVANPLLFDGHKFDFGIYVLVTSVEPLRFYYYDKNMIFRFCPKTYDISDPSDTDRYVVSDSKIPVWEFPGTKAYFDHGYNTRDAFNGFLHSIGADVEDIWYQIEDAIRSIIVAKSKHFVQSMERLGTMSTNHFELFRFDMILDTEHQLHILEINQHPNLYPSAHFMRNKVLYENLLYNVFTLLGAGTNFRKQSMRLPGMEVEKMIAHPHSMTVKPGACLSSYCERTCDAPCSLCWRCLSPSTKFDMLQAYREQTNSGDFKRLFPPSQDIMESVDELYGAQLTNKSRLHVSWYHEMCKKNRQFC